MKRLFTLLLTMMGMASMSASGVYAIWSEVGKTDTFVANPNNRNFTEQGSPYVIMCGDVKTLYFDYSSASISVGDTYQGSKVTELWSGDTEMNRAFPKWVNSTSYVEKVVILPSFKNYYPRMTSYWFYRERNDEYLAEIQGLEYLNTDNVEEMSGMFRYAFVEELDLTNFRTSKVKYMDSMFDQCSKLKTIYADDWDLSSLQNSSAMFSGCTSLVGGNGTEYSSSLLSASYAHIDTEANPGYFTAKPTGPTACAIWCEGNKTLYFDYILPPKPGDTYEGQTVTTVWSGDDVLNTKPNWEPGWRSVSTLASDVVFNERFAEAKPKCTDFWFNGFTSIKEFTGIENLNTSQVTSMKSMFVNCYSLKTIDLNSFDVSNVTDMSGMFYECNNLTTIYCDQSWTCENSVNMFWNCRSIVGGTGVTYDYTRYDGTMANPTTGYFTAKPTGPVPYVIWTESNHTLYFDYVADIIRDGSTYEGQTVTGAWNITDLYAWQDSDIPWTDVCAKVITVVFNERFANFKPTSTAYWFSGFNNLIDISGIENLNTQLVGRMTHMFYGCNKLKSLDVSSFNTESLGYVSAMFYGCESLTTLDLSNWNTDYITAAANLFEDCKSLIDLKLGNFNTSQLTTINGLFAGCESLTTIDLSSFNTSKVYGFGRLFENCKSLTDIDLSGFDMSSATLINGMFSGCESLTSLDLSNFVFEKEIENMNSMFYGCKNLETIYCAETWSSEKSSAMFYYCYALKGAVPFNYDNANDGTFANPTTGYFTAIPMPYVVWTEGDKTLRFVYTQDNITEGSSFNGQTVTKVWKGNVLNRYDTIDDMPTVAWAEQSRIAEKVVIDESFKDFRPTSTVFWFAYCNVSEIEGLCNLNTSEVTTMAGMFIMNMNLTKLDLSSFDTSKVTDMTGMFGYCQSLTSLDLSNFDTSNVASMTAMFAYDSQLTSINLSGFNTSNVEYMLGMFAYCSALTTLDLSHFDTSKVTNMEDMFANCANLTELNLYSFEVPVVEDVDEMFKDCMKLKTIYCPYSWTAKHSDDMFYNCLSLEGAVKFDVTNNDDVTFANPTTGYFTAEAPYAPGNVNGDKDRDGKDIIDINDVVCIINHMAGTTNWLPRANVNGDKKADGSPQVDINDVVAVINIMAGK